MKTLIAKIEEIIDRQIENESLKDEMSELRKMLKNGFENRTDGFEKIPKFFAVADEKKIKKFYDNFGNQIKAMSVNGDFEKFKEYLSINHGINIEVTKAFPNFVYTKNNKKKQKFYDCYSNYFVDDVPRDPQEAVNRITKSLGNIYKEFKKEEEPIKDDMKALIEAETEHSPLMLKTLGRIINTSKHKAEPLTNTAGTIEDRLNEQMKAVDIIEG